MIINGNCLVQVVDSDIVNGSLTIPVGITSIGASAFSDRSKLTTLSIPTGVTSIGAAAFSGCRNLITLSIPEGVTSIENTTFSGCISLTTLSIPKGVTSVGNAAFSGCNFTTLSIPEGVTSIEDRTFYVCNNLTTFSLPESVTSIGDSAFSYCSNLTTLSLPEGVASIEGSAFWGCDNLTTILISAQNDVEFQRIKGLLPLELQSLADRNGEESFRRFVAPIHKILADDTKAIGIDEEALEQLTAAIEAAQTHLESMKAFPAIYREQKKELDSLLVTVHLRQRDLRAALEYYQENPSLNEGVITELAFATLALDEGIKPADKNQAIISLFKAHHQIPGVQEVLSKSVLYLMHQQEPPVGETSGVKCVPLALMQMRMQQATHALGDTDPLKQIHQHLHLLTHLEILRLIGLSPIKEAFAKVPELGSGDILPVESFYTPQPALVTLDADNAIFLTTLLKSVEARKNEARTPNALIEQEALVALMDKVYPPLEEGQEASAESTTPVSNARNIHAFHNASATSAKPQDNSASDTLPAQSKPETQ